MILDIIARNNTVAQTVKTQQLWFKMVVAGFKMLYFLLLEIILLRKPSKPNNYGLKWSLQVSKCYIFSF